jgi:glycosyltransferase involved in cell wall biosynthesis
MKFSVVIPVYNEEEALPLLNRRLRKVMEKLSCEYEIIYVDDGSTDASPEILKGIKNSHPGKIKIVSFQNNRGQSKALMSGFESSLRSWIITLDADLQNPPGEIFKLLRFKNDFDFITGVRKKRRDAFTKKLSSKVAMYFRRLILKDTSKDSGCCLRIFRREIINSVNFTKNFHRYFPFIAKMQGYSVKEVDVRHSPRRFGKSKYGNFKRAKEGIFDLLGILCLKEKHSLSYYYPAQY